MILRVCFPTKVSLKTYLSRLKWLSPAVDLDVEPNGVECNC